MNPAPPDDASRCERPRLLLSLVLDAEATADQAAELDQHLAACAGCRAARTIDRAVADRLRQPTVAPARFAERVAALAARQRVEARAQNRFVAAFGLTAMAAAAAALLVLGPPGRAAGQPTNRIARDHAGAALSAHLAGGRAHLLHEER